MKTSIEAENSRELDEIDVWFPDPNCLIVKQNSTFSKSGPVFVSFSISKSNRMELSEFYKAKAFEDFGEDDLKRNQSLQQFREWIRKQTHIKSSELSMFS
jgi:hypothetical protein